MRIFHWRKAGNLPANIEFWKVCLYCRREIYYSYLLSKGVKQAENRVLKEYKNIRICVLEKKLKLRESLRGFPEHIDNLSHLIQETSNGNRTRRFPSSSTRQMRTLVLSTLL